MWLAAALLVLSAPPPEDLKNALGDAPLAVEADRLVSTGKAGIYVAEGHAIVRRGALVIIADRVTFDQTRHVAIAEGHVTMIEPTHVLVCTKVEMHMPELAGGLENAELHFKTPIPPEILEKLSASSLVHFGKDELIVTGDRIDRKDRRRFEVEGAVVTACDCGEGARPTWRIDATHAWVDLDSGAWLLFPVFYAQMVPVLALPVFYVPLGERRSGLLAPRINGLIDNPITGVRLAEPLYLVLGDSWDATLAPGWMTRRGPSGEGELRWAPSVDAKGEAHLQTLLDRGTYTSDIHVGHFKTARFALNVRHDERFESARVVADVNLVGDPRYTFEFFDVYLQRQAEWTMSRVTVTSTPTRDSTLRAAGGLQLMQDLRRFRYFNDPTLAPQIALFELRTVHLLSSEKTGPGDVRERLASLRLDAAPHPVGAKDSPLLGEARLMVDAFAAPLPESPRFARADFRPAVALPIHLFDLAVLKPEIAARMTAWTGRADKQTESETRLALIAKTSLFTELGRRYGDLVHRIRPELRYLIIPHVARSGSGVFENLDEIDLLQPVSQASARIATDLWEATSGRRFGGVEAWMGRDFGLIGRQAAGLGTSELVLKADAEFSPFALPVTARFDGRSAIDTTTGIMTELLTGLSFVSGGDVLSLLYGRLRSETPSNSLIASEELVPSGTFTTQRYLAQSDYLARVTPTAMNLGTPGDWRAALLGGQLDYAPWSSYRGFLVSALFRPLKQLLLNFDITVAPDPKPDNLPPNYTWSAIRNTRTTIRWDSDCDCFGLGLFGTTDRYLPKGPLGLPGLNFQFLISLGRLGEVRSGQ